MLTYGMLIGDRKVGPGAGEWVVVVNPATSEVVGRVPKGTRADADAALREAARAFPGWAATPPPKRQDILRQAVAHAREHVAEIAEALTREQGKPLRQARTEVESGLDTMDHMAEESRRVLGEIIPTEAADRLSFVALHPVGVVSAIVPWNFPINLLCWKLGPALASGCTVVAKPASQTPISALLLVERLLEGGLPAGTVNVVTGPGNTVGQELVESPWSRKVSFTGSTEMGRAILRDAAAQLKRVGLELGGNSPLLVLRDADLEQAIRGGVAKAFRNTGQICNSVNRIYVEAPIYEEFVEGFAAATGQLTIGDGLKNPDVDMGPLIDDAARRHVREHMQDALEKGATLAFGGREPSGGAYAHGFFFEPTVLASAHHGMRVMQEETFGPMAPIMRVADFDEACRLANESPYGLAAYVYTRSLAHAVEAARRLEFGSVAVNETSFTGGPYPTPAWKQSGLGVELSQHGLREYLQIKHIRVRVPALSAGSA